MFAQIDLQTTTQLSEGHQLWLIHAARDRERDRDRDRDGYNRKQWLPVPVPLPL